MKCRLHYVMMEQSFRGYALDSHEASALGGNMPATYGKRGPFGSKTSTINQRQVTLQLTQVKVADKIQYMLNFNVPLRLFCPKRKHIKIQSLTV